MGPQTKLAVGTAAAMLSLVVATAAAKSLPDDQPLAPVAPTPEGAVQEAVSAASAVYAGDCATTSSPANLGQVCSRFIGQRAVLRAYLAGRTFSEFDTWVFVKQTASGWVPVGIRPADETASPGTAPWPAP
jgi:hypothetical protein